MSLLLDALKKAAKDKEARSASATGTPESTTPEASGPVSADEHKELELTLDDIDASPPEPSVPNDPDQGKPPQSEEKPLSVDYEPVPQQMSDEALHVLIYKTNHAHKRRRRIIWGSAIIFSAIVMASSGLYFFKQIQHGIAMLELRHRVNMRAVESEPVKAKNLPLAVNKSVSKTTPKSADIKSKAPGSSKPAVKNSRVASQSSHNATQYQHRQNAITVVRGQKKDPVGDLLTRAWTAYNASDYEQASKLYTQVLEREKNNRDALMGMGAIAVKNKNDKQALQYYNRMLQLDPRDPVANAAILNMNNSMNEDQQSESRLLYLIKMEPDAAHLYYALGNKYAAQSKWPEAESAYFSAFEHDSSSADYAYNLAVSLERIGRSKQAVQYYRAALQLAQGSNVSFSIDVVEKRLSQIKP